jgi:hypothetical protein
MNHNTVSKHLTPLWVLWIYLDAYQTIGMEWEK